MKQNKNTDLPGTEKVTGRQKKYDWVVKLLCICSAFILWLYVMEVESPEYETTIGGVIVELIGTDDLESKNGLSVYSGRGVPITVTVSGKRSVVSKLTQDDIVATADVSDITEAGRHNIPIIVDPLSNVTINQKTQDNVLVYVDQAETAIIPVRENIVSMDLTHPYEMGTIQFESNSINISGPKNVLSNVAAARVDLDIGERKDSYTTVCEIYLVDKYNNRISNTYLNYSPTEITVDIPIYKSVTVPVEVKFQHGYLDDTNSVITVTPSQVTIKGEESVMDESSLLAPIVLDEKKITENSYGKTVILQPAAGTFIDDDITEVQVSVEIDASIQSMDLIVTDIEATGADGIRYAIEDEEMSVTIRGPIDKLQKIRPSDLYAVVDLSGYSAESSGTVTKTADIIIDAEDAEGIYEVGEYTVQVRIN